jgi:AmmeMemoRadiSam system protein B
MTIIRRPAVAGKFYPQSPRQLESDVRHMLDAAEVVECQPKILIAPHAGYEYSGPIAATAFATLRRRRATIQRVVMLGTCHTSHDPKIFTTSADSFETPLGLIDTDTSSIQLAVRQGLAVLDDQVHQFDHAIEVQLPFLQLTLDRFEIAPFLLSNAPSEQAAHLIQLLWGAAETVFVISSDLSHYLHYEQARATDQQTAESIVQLDDKSIDQARACGFSAIAAALQVARKKSLQCVKLDLRNSGDTSGFKDRVVGYGAFAFLSSD